jgi:hypothetical protein
MTKTLLQSFATAATTLAANQARIIGRQYQLMDRARISSAWQAEYSADLHFRKIARFDVEVAFEKVLAAGVWADVLEASRMAYEAGLDAANLREMATFVRVTPSLEPNPLVAIWWVVEETVETSFLYARASYGERTWALRRLEALSREAQQYAYHAYKSLHP